MKNHWCSACLLAIMVAGVMALGSGCQRQPVINQPQYQGMTLAIVVQQLGQPSHTEEFTMGGAIGEFRVELLNTYPTSDPNNAQVPIKELWWDQGSHNLTIWFHHVNGQWSALDAVRWHKDIRF